MSDGEINVDSIDGEVLTTANIVGQLYPQGEKGDKGDPGNDGFSPTVTTEKVGKTTTITITDAEGEHTATILDGADGQGSGNMRTEVYDINHNGIVDDAEKVNGHTVGIDVPANAVFTDTTYTAGTGIDITGNVITNTQTSAEWGNITGTLSDQTDLKNALDDKANASAVPTKVSDLNNDSGFIDKDVNNLTNYDTSTTVDTKISNSEEVLIGSDSGIKASHELWVDTSDVTPYVNSEISNDYGTAQNLGYSQAYQNDHNIVVSPTQPIDESKVWLQHIQNLYDGSIDKIGYIVASDGTETANNSGFISDYIKVEPNTTYTFSYNSTDYSYAMRYAEYDTNKTFIQRTYNSNAIYTFTTTATTEYLKLSSSIIATDLGSAKLVLGSDEIANKEYILDNENYADYKIQQAGDLVVDSVRTKNLFDSSKYNTTSQVRVVDNQLGVLELNGLSGYYAGVTAKFKVKPNVTYTLSYVGIRLDTSVASTTYVAVLKLDGTTKIADNGNQGKQSITFSTTEEGVILDFRVNNTTNVGKTRYSWIQLEEGSVATPYTPYQDLESNEKYTTTETRIGTWINGKPLYRKVITYTPTETIGSTGGNTNINIAHGISNFGKLIKASCVIMHSTNGNTYNLPYINGLANMITMTELAIVNASYLSFRIINDTWDTNSTFVFTLEYTKTTD